MAKRVLLSNTIEPDNAGFEQNLAVVLLEPAQAKKLLKRVEQVKKLKAKDSDLYMMEFWSGSVEYFVDRKLADVILKVHDEDHPEAKRIADLVRDGVSLGQQLLPVDDPEEVLESACNNYDDEGDEVDDDTRFDCYTVVVDDDSIQYTALAKYGSGEGIKTARIRVDYLRWLAGENVNLDEKIEAPTQ